MAIKTQARICTRCVLPDNFPGAIFDSEGVCNFCVETPSVAQLKDNVTRLRTQMEEAIALSRGAGEYDCIVAYSGGKDSSYTLKWLVEHYELKCLAVTIDNGFMSEQARVNAQAVTANLGVDYLMFAPAWSFLSRMYSESATNSDVHSKAAIKRASAICNSCIGLINVYMLKLALQHGTKIVAGGYIGGQVPKDTAILELDLAVYMRTRTNMIERYKSAFGDDATHYYQLPEALLNSTPLKKITILNPMLTLQISEEEIIEKLAPLGWKPTLDTGSNSSNCRLNDFGIAMHSHKHGFNPYVFELSEQVRHGLMTREKAMKKALTVPSLDEVRWQAERLELDIDALR
jgi:7-cyano-7-deazaguanine synthase in queuosine biosynthesis